MMRLANIIKRFDATFRHQYHGKLLPSHLKTLADLKFCRSQYALQMETQCDACGKQQRLPHSCGNRHCPHCQQHESQQWIDRELQKKIPAEYFMVTFTLPKQLRPLAYHNQSVIFNLMFESVWQTLSTFCQNDKELNGIAGMTAVLHTHMRSLDHYHPHIHVIMPAAAINQHHQLQTKTGYLFKKQALAKVFSAKMFTGIRKVKLHVPRNCPSQWIVHVKSVGEGSKAIIYLGRYLYRGVIL